MEVTADIGARPCAGVNITALLIHCQSRGGLRPRERRDCQEVHAQVSLSEDPGHGDSIISLHNSPPAVAAVWRWLPKPNQCSGDGEDDE